MKRVEAIKKIYNENKGSFFVLSNGLTSREAAYFLPQKNSLYLLHAMGEALSVGIGLASARPELNVVVIDGDGNAMMGIASWNCVNGLKNLKYYILKNNTYCTTGSQKLPEFSCLPNWCKVIEIFDEKEETPNPPKPEEIIKNVIEWLEGEKNDK